MCKTKLHAGDTVGEQVAQTGCKEDTDRFIDFQLSAKAVDAIAEERTGNRHREGVGAQSGQTAVCQQQRLEEQNNDADDAHGRRSKQDGTQTGAGRMGAGAGDTGNF